MSGARAFSLLSLSTSLYFLVFPSTGSTSCTSLHLLYCILANVRVLDAHSSAASRFPFPENWFFQTQKRKRRQQYGSASVQHQVQVNPTQTIALVRRRLSPIRKAVLVKERWDGC
ncbi:hypothetical protein LXA43DRAFT_247649 [Ganoderma leucocontextum]|nr:hypothetical protein LXA43DRAFT_247649 [Ganoderma leucocontextum]